MENKFSGVIEKLQEEVFPTIREILVVYLFGSVSRGDFSLRHSDLDLFLILKTKTISSDLKKRIEEKILPIGLADGVIIQLEYQTLQIKPEDKTLIEKMIEEGKIIYATGVFTFEHQQIGLIQYLIYDFSLKNAKNKTMFSKVLHGRKSWYYKDKQKVLKVYPGIINNKDIIELGKGTLMVSKAKEKDLKQIFANFKVEYKLKKIVYA